MVLVLCDPAVGYYVVDCARVRAALWLWGLRFGLCCVLGYLLCLLYVGGYSNTPCVGCVSYLRGLFVFSVLVAVAVYGFAVPGGVVCPGFGVDAVVGDELVFTVFVVDVFAVAGFGDFFGCAGCDGFHHLFVVFLVGYSVVVHPFAFYGFAADFLVVYAIVGGAGDDGELYGGEPVPVGGAYDVAGFEVGEVLVLGGCCGGGVHGVLPPLRWWLVVCARFCWADVSIIGWVCGGCRAGNGVLGCGVAYTGVA